MEIFKAGINDIDLLIKLRIDYETDDDSPLPPEELCDLTSKLEVYFKKHIENKGFIAYIAREGDTVCSAAFLSIVERPPRDAFISYKVGTVYNVFTYPEYRRRGIGKKVMEALIAEAKRLGVATIDLSATDSGKPLYEKLGFNISKFTAMRLKLQG